MGRKPKEVTNAGGSRHWRGGARRGLKVPQWFRQHKNRFRVLYFGLLGLASACSLAASLIAALNLMSEPWGRPALIVLPLIATLSASLIQQFNLRELYQLREQGRIDAMELVYLVERSRPKTFEELSKLEETVYSRLTEIARGQSASFFAFLPKPDRPRPSHASAAPPT